MALTASVDVNGPRTLMFWLPCHVDVEILETGSSSETPLVYKVRETEPACVVTVVDPPFPCTRSPDTLPACAEISVIKVRLLAISGTVALRNNPPPEVILTCTLPAVDDRRRTAGFSPDWTSMLTLMLPLVVERSRRSYNWYVPEIERNVSCSRCSRFGNGGQGDADG